MNTPKTDPKVAVGFLRVSTEDQGLGPTAQRAAIEQWAALRGVSIVAWHEDIGVSGAAPLDECPGLLAAIADLATLGAGVLVVAKRDRLARDPMRARFVENLARKAGALVCSAAGEGDGEDANAIFMRGVFDLIAELERGTIRSRTKQALAVKRKRGELTGTAPFGYRAEATGPLQTRNGTTRRTAVLVPDEQEQATIATVRELRASGLSLARICAELDARGIKPRGGKWHANSVFRVLRRESDQVPL